MKLFHQDIYDKGLEQVTNSANWAGGVLSLVVCEDPPSDFTDASTLPTNATPGERVSSEIALAAGDLTLADKAGGGREVTVAAKSGTVADPTVNGDDLHIAIYDGSRLLVVTDETSDQILTAGNTINLPSYTFGFSGPA